MNDLESIIGNDGLCQQLAREIRQGTLSHAYILEGAHGSGRKTLALAISAALSCENRLQGKKLPCGCCTACKKILEGKSPDIIRVSPEGKASIGVEDIRFLRSDVYIPPNDSDTKVYLIEDADTMTLQAQNALLLTLEEPPSYVLFLLICQNASNMLETIRSRTQLLRLCPIGKEQLSKFLSENEVAYRALSPAEKEEILLLSGGSVGRAKELLNPAERKPILERRKLAKSFVEGQLGRKEAAELLRLIGSFGNKRDEICLLLADIALAYRDLLLLKRADTVELCFYTDKESAQLLAERTSAQLLISKLETVENTRKQMMYNGNVRLLLTALALD